MNLSLAQNRFLAFNLRRLVRVAVVALSCIVPCAAEEMTLDNGKSPNGQYETFLAGDSGEGDFGVEVRLASDGSRVAFLPWGYGIMKYAPEFTVIKWSADSRFVAIKLRDTKRTFRTSIFYLDGRKTRIVKPDLDYFQNICGRLGTLGQDFRNRNETPINFASSKRSGSNLTLRVEVPSPKEDVELSFDVLISCYPPFSDRNSGDPEPHATVVKITGPAADAPSNP
jgi:hypothetical protein